MIQYRIHWEMASNATVKGATDWDAWDGDESTRDAVIEALAARGGRLSRGLDEAIAGSGFSWWPETREVPDA